MLLQILRHSTATARFVLAWFVLAMGVAVAAPALQPLTLGPVCSSTAGSEGGVAPSLHSAWQCIQCLHLGAPAPLAVQAVAAHTLAGAPVWRPAPAAHAAPPYSPLLARAPPRT